MEISTGTATSQALHLGSLLESSIPNAATLVMISVIVKVRPYSFQLLLYYNNIFAKAELISSVQFLMAVTFRMF